MEQVSKSAFKPRALAYFRQVQQTGEPLIVTEHGRPVLRIVPYTPPLADPWSGLREALIAYEAPEEPVGEGDWEALR